MKSFYKVKEIFYYCYLKGNKTLVNSYIFLK